MSQDSPFILKRLGSCAKLRCLPSFLSFFLFLILVSPQAANAQGKPPFSNRELKANAIPAGMEAPKLDGDLSDSVWKFAAKADNFINPENNKPAVDQTEAYLLYDKNAIYLGFYCHDSKPEFIVARETVRDSRMGDDDTVRVILDPFLNRKYDDFNFFTINARGTRNTDLPAAERAKSNGRGIGKPFRRSSKTDGFQKSESPGLSCPIRVKPEL